MVIRNLLSEEVTIAPNIIQVGHYIFKDCKDASCAGKKKEELEDKFR